MKTDELNQKLKIFSYIVLALMVALCLRLMVIQLFDNERYQAQAKENRIRLVSIKAPRGEIYANSGETLAANELVYTLNLSLVDNQIDEAVLNRLVEALRDYYPDITRDVIEEKIEGQKYRLFEPITPVSYTHLSWYRTSWWRVALERVRQTYQSGNQYAGLYL